MLVEVKVPVLAESVANATLLEWYKQAGDRVKRGDNLIDLETDKVTLEVAAPDDGVLVEIRLPNGATANSQDVLAVIDTEAASGTKTTFTPVAPEAPAAAPTATPSKFGPAVEHLLTEHSLKPDAIPASGRDGRLTKGDVLQFISAAEPAAAETMAAQNTPAPEPVAAVPVTAALVPSPATTPQAQVPPPVPRAAEISATPSSPPRIKGPEERVRMTRLRRATAERLLAAQRDNAILTTFNEVDMQPVLALRDRHQETFGKRHGARLGFMSFFVKAVVAALQRFPVVNASVDGEDLVYHHFFDIGIAVGTERGLVVPVLRRADALSFAEIETHIADFGARARDGKLTIEELTGGTFTITNGGVFGSLLSTPILNPPQSAILGMHKIQQRPMVVDGAIVIRPMMYLALSYDHRIIDGREAVQFLVAVKDQLEDPARMLLQV